MLHWLPKGLVYSSKNVSLNFSLVRRSCRFAGKIIRNILKQNTCLAHVQDMKFPEIGVPQNGWFMMETAIKIDDLGYPHLRKRVSSIIWPQLGDPWRPNLLQWRHQGYGCQPRQPGPGLSAQFSHVSHFSANMSISNLWQFSSIFPQYIEVAIDWGGNAPEDDGQPGLLLAKWYQSCHVLWWFVDWFVELNHLKNDP